MAHLALGDFDAAWHISIESMTFGDAVGHPAYALSRVWQSLLLATVGEDQRALVIAREADVKATHFPPFRPMTLANLARILLHLGQVEVAAEVRNESAGHLGSQTLIVFEITNGFLESELALAAEQIG